MDKKIYLTKDGLAEIQKEYNHLVNDKRPVILERLSQARSMGDLSENAEYTAAKEELAFIDGRIDEIEELLNQVVLIEEHAGRSGKRKPVELGSKVMLNFGRKRELFTVVGEWEADPANKKISHQSPLGKALIGKVSGEKVEVEAPAGKIVYTVLSVN